MLRWSALLLFLPLFHGCGAAKAEHRALSNPNDAEAWEKLGNAYRRQLKLERASDAYREALRIDPERSHLAKRVQSRASKETRDMRRAAMANPGDDELWGDLGDALRYDGDLMGARQAYMRAFQIDPNDSEWHRALVDLGSAEAVLEHAGNHLNQGDDESLGDYADLLAITGQQEEACSYWRRAAELDPYDEEWIGHAVECGYPVPEGAGAMDTGNYADPYYTGGDLPSADDIGGLVERINNDAGLLTRLGQAYLQAGDREKARENLWAALLVAPTDEEALQSYLVAAQRTRRQALERLRSTFPDNDEVIGSLADHYLDLGMRSRAADLYALAHSLDEDDPEWKAKKALLE